VLSDAALGREVGADAYVSSLREAVDACLKVAAGSSLRRDAPAVARVD
jgi:hypothetical protein